MMHKEKVVLWTAEGFHPSKYCTELELFKNGLIFPFAEINPLGRYSAKKRPHETMTVQGGFHIMHPVCFLHAEERNCARGKRLMSKEIRERRTLYRSSFFWIPFEVLEAPRRSRHGTATEIPEASGSAFAS